MAANEKYLTKSDLNNELVWEHGSGEHSAQIKDNDLAANGDYSVAEGYDNSANGDYSHAEGYHTIANNKYEHAEGSYNVSNKASNTYGSSGNTQHSVGIGTASTNTMNAFEIMQNGDAYLYGVGGYNGKNATASTSNSLQSVLSGISEEMQSVTWSQLRTLRDSSKLTPGKWYRITDYTCTTSESNTRSAGHRFDVVVLALSTNKLSEEARATYNASDTYFSDNGAVLNAWKIWYCLDNDYSRFRWASSNSGKGVIYRMIDEYNNDCPYDFKNMQFNVPCSANYNYVVNGTNKYVYTFNCYLNNDGVVRDSSCYNPDPNNVATYAFYHAKDNTILANISQWDGARRLNRNVFFTFGTWYDDGCGNITCEYMTPYNNFLGKNCVQNYFAYGASMITLGSNCSVNRFYNDEAPNGDYVQISLGNNCANNKFDSYNSNIELGNNCSHVSFDYSCDRIKIGNGASYINIGNDSIEVTIGNNCSSITTSSSCYAVTIGNSSKGIRLGETTTECRIGNYCSGITFGPSSASVGYDYYKIIIGDGNQNIVLADENQEGGNSVGNVVVDPYLNTSSTWKTIVTDGLNDRTRIYRKSTTQIKTIS